MKRKITIDIPYLAGALLSFGVAFGLLTGYIQQFVHFAGELNEFATCVLALSMGLGLVIASVEFPKAVEDGSK